MRTDDNLYYSPIPGSNTNLVIDYLDSNYFVQTPTSTQESDYFIPNINYMKNYYKHLGTNVVLNKLGVCGYTALGMFLSFYDTYWNDGIIMDYVDSDRTEITYTQLLNPTSYSYQSPGVFNNLTDNNSPSMDDIVNSLISQGYTPGTDAYKSALDITLMDFVYSQINNQTFLGHLFNIALNEELIEHHYDQNGNVISNKYLSGFGVNYEFTNTMLDSYILSNQTMAEKVDIVTSRLQNSSQTEKTRIRNEIINNLQDGRPVLMGGQNFIDSNNNGVYDLGESYGGHVIVAYEYDLISDKIYGNFGWGDSYTHYDVDTYFNKEISDYWALSFSSNLKYKRTNNYYITDKTSFYFPGTDDFYNLIRSRDYCYPQSYDDTETIDNVTPFIEDSDEIIYTKRIRTGYINNECINLSTKRRSPGIAYLELTFDKVVSSFEVDLSWWSNNEGVTIHNSDYRIEYLNNGNYFTLVDLWRDVSLSTDRIHPTHISVNLPIDTYTIRFYGICNNPINDRNKGRLSIFDLIVSYDL